ncbi:hypothetical protein POPTR_005G031948v4 [Populus trichocarpa]|uniref:Uncharacterized protein n=1 Tax=Populus trichocarpa TaxID=3694 RepID=A0ACC0SXH8_POPTR|nr:hypothetical protein POPTR_005G031948v4 [Populus trichocarpa]
MREREREREHQAVITGRIEGRSVEDVWRWKGGILASGFVDQRSSSRWGLRFWSSKK